MLSLRACVLEFIFTKKGKKKEKKKQARVYQVNYYHHFGLYGAENMNLHHPFIFPFTLLHFVQFYSYFLCVFYFMCVNIDTHTLRCIFLSIFFRDQFFKPFHYAFILFHSLFSSILAVRAYYSASSSICLHMIRLIEHNVKTWH